MGQVTGGYNSIFEYAHSRILYTRCGYSYQIPFEICLNENLKYCLTFIVVWEEQNMIEPLSMLEPMADLLDNIQKIYKVTSKKKREENEWKNLEDAYLQHLKWRFEYPAEVLERQNKAYGRITYLVISLVGGGLLFSFVQLLWALRLGNFSSLETELAIQTAGELSFRSSLVGASVLVISLMFFYLYLRHAFKVEPVPPFVGFEKADTIQILRNVVRQEIEDAKSKFDTSNTEAKGIR